MGRRGHTAAVVKGTLRHFSVSQIKTFHRCPRLWYSDKVLGIKQLRKPAAEKGADLHKQPEAYYLTGAVPKHEAFLSALPGLPKRQSGLLVEHDLVNPTLFIEGVRFDGYSDLVVPPECSPDGIPEIRDWKFVGTFRYMEDPANDIQMLTYGYWASKMWPEAREIRLGLHYLLADGSDFKHRVVDVPVERCESEWHDIVAPTVRRMQAMVAEGHAAGWTLEQTPDNRGDPCYKYGGCHLLERCGVVPKGKADREVRTVLKDFDAGL